VAGDSKIISWRFVERVLRSSWQLGDFGGDAPRFVAREPMHHIMAALLVLASACLLASRMQKLSVASWTSHGGGKRRSAWTVACFKLTV
jgi:hypothetical protein